MQYFSLRLESEIPHGSVAELVDAPDLKSVERFSSWGFKSLHSHFNFYKITLLYLLVISNNGFNNMEISSILSNPILVLIEYAIILSLYLIIIPLSLFYWMNNRWNVMGKFERLGIYGLVFLFFPGLILFSPFLNLRLNGEEKG